MVGDNIMFSTRNLKPKSCPGKLQLLYVGPFKVAQVVGCNAFNLDLPIMLRVHPVFNVSLPWWYTGDRMLSAPLEVDNKTAYIVNSILWHQGRHRHY